MGLSRDSLLFELDDLLIPEPPVASPTIKLDATSSSADAATAGLAAAAERALAAASSPLAGGDGQVDLRLMGQVLLLQGYRHVWLRTACVGLQRTGSGASSRSPRASSASGTATGGGGGASMPPSPQSGLRHTFLVVQLPEAMPAHAVAMPAQAGGTDTAAAAASAACSGAQQPPDVSSGQHELESLQQQDPQMDQDLEEQQELDQEHEQQDRLVVVEPRFRLQFELPDASPAYAAAWQALPELFVGGAEALAELVDHVCGQMAAEFERAGRPTPPWRTPAFLRTKWLCGPDEVASEEQLTLEVLAPAPGAGAAPAAAAACAGACAGAGSVAGSPRATYSPSGAAEAAAAAAAVAAAGMCLARINVGAGGLKRVASDAINNGTGSLGCCHGDCCTPGSILGGSLASGSGYAELTPGSIKGGSFASSRGYAELTPGSILSGSIGSGSRYAEFTPRSTAGGSGRAEFTPGSILGVSIASPGNSGLRGSIASGGGADGGGGGSVMRPCASPLRGTAAAAVAL